LSCLFLSLLAIQASAATAGLSLWPQVAAVPPGSNTTAVTETVQPPANQSGTPASTAAPAAAAVKPGAAPASGQNGMAVVPLAIGPASASTPAQRPPGSAGPSAPVPGFPPQAVSTSGPGGPVRQPSQRATSGRSSSGGSRAGAQTETRGTSESEGKRRTGSRRTPAAKPVEEPPDTPNQPPVLAASPSKFAIGVNGKRVPAASTLVLWADRPSRAIEVTAKPDWLRVAARRQGGKGERRYDVTVDTEGLPAGRIHDGVLNVRSSRGSLTIPVVVEMESTR
jgi:hypothetical protein